MACRASPMPCACWFRSKPSSNEPGRPWPPFRPFSDLLPKPSPAGSPPPEISTAAPSCFEPRKLRHLYGRTGERRGNAGAPAERTARLAAVLIAETQYQRRWPAIAQGAPPASALNSTAPQACRPAGRRTPRGQINAVVAFSEARRSGSLARSGSTPGCPCRSPER